MAGPGCAFRRRGASTPDEKKTHPLLKSDGSHHRGDRRPFQGGVSARRHAHACFLSKNCSSSVEPFSAPVDASRSIVVVTASK